MVHDEEAEISIRLVTLIANTQRNRSAMDPLPLNVPQASGTGAAADGNVAQKAQASPGNAASFVSILVSPPDGMCCQHTMMLATTLDSITTGSSNSYDLHGHIAAASNHGARLQSVCCTFAIQKGRLNIICVC